MSTVEVVFIETNGTRHAVRAPVGHTLMEAAIANAVPGVLAECGGFCACATCHVYVGPDWMARLPPRSAMEAGLLEGAIEPTHESRLACQLTLEPVLDGLTVRTPRHQI